VNILKSLETDEEKIRGILKRHIPVEDSKLVFAKTGKSVDITIPDELFRADGLQIMKHFIQSEIFKFVPSLEKINFLETYLNKSLEAQKKTETTTSKTEKPVAQKTS
jgi:peptidylprolyl isomerase